MALWKLGPQVLTMRQIAAYVGTELRRRLVPGGRNSVAPYKPKFEECLDHFLIHAGESRGGGSEGYVRGGGRRGWGQGQGEGDGGVCAGCVCGVCGGGGKGGGGGQWGMCGVGAGVRQGEGDDWQEGEWEDLCVCQLLVSDCDYGGKGLS